jgi:Tfp pilus assembly protein PilF
VTDSEKRQRAIALWNEAMRRHQVGDFAGAIGLYSESIALYPTAEAYTFRGWAYQSLGMLDEAIAECQRAIAIDPEFGNPYNDIGAYLIAKGDLDSAIEWLEHAKRAPRYEPRHFPYMNLGRIYAAKGMVRRAIDEFEGALAIAPGEPVCVEALARLRSILN